MLKIVALCLCWSVFLVSVDGNGSGQLVPNGSSTQAVVKEKESIAVVPEPTPTEGPVTTTQPPQTTTPPTTTINPKPPIPDTTTTTSTEAPTTTTTVTPITTPIPSTTPTPAPKTGKWVVNGTNTTCIVVRMSVQFNITYMTKDNKTEHQMLTLPTEENSTVATGDCGFKEQTLSITWHGGNDSLILHFVKNETTKHYYMHHVQVSLESEDFPNAQSNATLELLHEPDQFTTSLDNSYRCMRLQKLDLKQNGTVTNGTISWLQISDLQFQAFKTDKADNFGFAEDCQSPDVVPDVVPIAVGCVLTVLVILVLVAYLLGRRRSQARGYLSM